MEDLWCGISTPDEGLLPSASLSAPEVATRSTICRNAIDRGIASSFVDARLTETYKIHNELG